MEGVDVVDHQIERGLGSRGNGTLGLTKEQMRAPTQLQDRDAVQIRDRAATELQEAVPGLLDIESHTVMLRREGDLARLKAVASGPSSRFGWSEAQAVAFVLSGLIPLVARGTGRVNFKPDMPAANRITLEVSARITPKEVARFYGQIRSSGFLGLPAHRPSRPLTRERAELGVFAAKVNGGRSWRQAMDDWNKEHDGDGRSYEDIRTFVRDCRQAYERITGTALDWQGAKAQQER